MQVVPGAMDNMQSTAGSMLAASIDAAMLFGHAGTEGVDRGVSW